MIDLIIFDCDGVVVDSELLANTHLYKYFEGKIFSAQMVNKGKPAPDIFLLAAEKMHASPAHCLVIEDSVPGVRAAKAAGMKVLGFCGGSHMFDFMKEKLEAEKPDDVFDHMDQLPDIIERLKS